MPIIGYEDERMVQKTIGVVNFNGVQYEIDWRYYEEDGEIIAAEPAAWVFLDGEQIIDFVNPRGKATGWHTKKEVLYDADRLIKNGHMHSRIVGRELGRGSEIIMTDMINNPPHYRADNGMQGIDVVEAFFPTDPHLSHVFKYMVRAHKKDTPESNIRKAIWWLVRKLTFITGDKYLPLQAYRPLPPPIILGEGERDGAVVDIFNKSIRIRIYDDLTLETTAIIPLRLAESVALDILSRLEDRK